ncbi:MAG: hypothetical protein HS132_12870 [Planctomycetia bacterium]|nr:hypothetical protein [Planctomycetia bacterium]
MAFDLSTATHGGIRNQRVNYDSSGRMPIWFAHDVVSAGPNKPQRHWNVFGLQPLRPQLEWNVITVEINIRLSGPPAQVGGPMAKIVRGNAVLSIEANLEVPTADVGYLS